MRPTAKSYFSGGGGLDYGFQQEGIEIIQSLEIDKTCVQTLKKNFTHKILHADICDIEVKSQPKSDIIIGTYPCKKYSNIADIHGTRTGDELFLHFFRHMAIERPEAYVLENVPGMKKFKVVMEAMTKLPGYYINIFCPVDALHWLPQKRERLILIGTKKRISISPPKNTRRITLKEIVEKNVNIEIPDYFYNRVKGNYRDKPIISDPRDLNDFAPTCVAHYSKDVSTRVIKDKAYKYGIRPYTTREYARLQGFPDSFEFAGSDNKIYEQIGNAVPPPMARWIARELRKYFNK
jgi:DNA (cytosine-5)-methyltransferase 1